MIAGKKLNTEDSHSFIILLPKVREQTQKNRLLCVLVLLERNPKPHQGRSFQTFVDNNSEDQSAKMVEEGFPQVKLIKNKENLGFSKANNIAIKQSGGDFILLLNPDMQVFENTLEKALEFAKENPQAVVSSCKLVDEKNNIIRHVRRFPKYHHKVHGMKVV